MTRATRALALAHTPDFGLHEGFSLSRAVAASSLSEQYNRFVSSFTAIVPNTEKPAKELTFRKTSPQPF